MSGNDPLHVHGSRILGVQDASSLSLLADCSSLPGRPWEITGSEYPVHILKERFKASFWTHDDDRDIMRGNLHFCVNPIAMHRITDRLFRFQGDDFDFSSFGSSDAP